LVGLEREVFKCRRFSGHLISAASFRRFLASPASTLIIAQFDGQAGGQLSGYVLVLYRANSAFARLYSIGVAADFQGRGLARLLLRAAERDAIKRRLIGMRLEVRADDPGALRLYETSGYRCFGRRRGYYGRRVDALRLDKSLVEEPRRRS
jgi:ribosomal protein S18 acetylase RimI-like enzyme